MNWYADSIVFYYSIRKEALHIIYEVPLSMIYQPFMELWVGKDLTRIIHGYPELRMKMDM